MLSEASSWVSEMEEEEEEERKRDRGKRREEDGVVLCVLSGHYRMLLERLSLSFVSDRWLAFGNCLRGLCICISFLRRRGSENMSSLCVRNGLAVCRNACVCICIYI